ncbi:MAG: hypothetical protein ACQESR_02140 [Planctomycetota bacterium]
MPREIKKWLCETYGSDFRTALENWCDEIAKHAPFNTGALLLVPLEEVLDNAEKPWSYVWQQLQDRTAVDRLRSLLAVIRDRRPPFELLATEARFLTQETFWINIIAVVRVDRVSKQVHFTYFHWYGDGE